MKLFGKSETFIEIYDNAISQKECDMIISKFEKSKLREGFVNYEGGREIDHRVKKCMEIDETFLSDGSIISRILVSALNKYTPKYEKKFESTTYLSHWSVQDMYNVQKYDGEDDGFKEWHTEHGTGTSAPRVLAWMFYLNNAKSGTEFMHYPSVSAKAGRLVIWPAGFTHLHRGIIPNRGIKYIATGWMRFTNDSIPMNKLAPIK